MKRLSMRNLRRAFVVTGVASMAILSGCATTVASTPLTAEQGVTQRAQERWDHLLKSQYAVAYTYLTPAERAVTSEENYIQRFNSGASWVSAKVASATCDGADRCTVTINLETRVVARGFRDPLKTTPTEIWVFENGKWWFHKIL